MDPKIRELADAAEDFVDNIDSFTPPWKRENRLKAAIESLESVDSQAQELLSTAKDYLKGVHSSTYSEQKEVLLKIAIKKVKSPSTKEVIQALLNWRRDCEERVWLSDSIVNEALQTVIDSWGPR